MKELAGRLAALDPDAGAALRVIAYFDRLTEDRAGLEALVRGAAVLSGSPARLVDERRGVRVRVEPDGRRRDAAGPLDPAWPWVPLTPGTSVRTASAALPPPAGPDRAGPHPDDAGLWLEHPGPADGVHAMILERAVAAVRVVLDRTRGRAPSVPPADDPALVETVLDASAPRAVRLHAAARLGLGAEQRVRAVALYGGGAEVEPVDGRPADGRPADGRPAERAGRRAPDGRRAGIGPAVEPVRLPESWAAARTALRFTAEGTTQDPGPRTVHADELGALTLLADAVGPDMPPIPDLLAVERAVAEAPWAAATLHAVASSPSLRSAAAELTVHHSTLQERLGQLEHALDWDVHSPHGRLRLQLALAVRKLRRTAPPPATG
ncbi:helix-turn-helix domain-containing protein [Streptomyces yaanensis]|uniref:Helix-turn-helix domain-containing protein n=1 Tax=Streptomyces yaanensis TaxID=1142239 RepID=A0ABV7S7P3_9ACTN|nr:helix-turn-helix domain-containing protein [Streptomyces sp. CGMCC 4.7035]WNB99863.1 helix-turn-helix domain-containing protein [Streptomyces sp. CGMCC 4.7035]